MRALLLGRIEVTAAVYPIPRVGELDQLCGIIWIVEDK
jgi:hypothetical protein